MKKKDLILIVSILAVAAVLGIGFLLFGRSGQTYVTASVDGKEIGRWPLAKDREIDLDTDYGHNLLVIKDGTAKMAPADCPDGYCLHERAISRRGDVIVCLPHHLVVEGMTSGEDVPEDEDAVDAVAR